MRSISPALAAELGLTVTRPGYLVQIDFPTVLRLSTLGDVSFANAVWSAADIKVSAIAHAEGGTQTCALSLGNLALDYGSLILNEAIADRAVTIWAVWAGAPAEAIEVFRGIGDDAMIGNRVDITLISDARRYAYSPRRFIGMTTGFTTLLPAGTRLSVGGQNYLLERA